MKVFVNGLEVELSDNEPGFLASNVGNLVVVKTPNGAKTAVVRQVSGKTLVSYEGRVYQIEPVTRTRKSGGTASGELKAMMPGLIVDVLVKAGDAVMKGQKLVVLEAMKTQQPIESPFDGFIETINVEKGNQVSDGELLVKVSPKLP